MYIHRARIKINSNSFIELSRKIQSEILPVLRLQKGFCKSNVSTDRQRTSSTGDTYWKTKEDAENYQKTSFLMTLKMLSGIAVGEPIISIFEYIS